MRKTVVDHLKQRCGAVQGVALDGFANRQGVVDFVVTFHEGFDGCFQFRGDSGAFLFQLVQAFVKVFLVLVEELLDVFGLDFIDDFFAGIAPHAVDDWKLSAGFVLKNYRFFKGFNLPANRAKATKMYLFMVVVVDSTVAKNWKMSLYIWNLH